MYNSQYYTCEQIDERLLQGYLDDYNQQNNTNLSKAEFLTLIFNTIGRNSTVDNLVTQVGYYECDTAAGTAAKVLSVASYALFVGGSMKVKFANKNTANNATLNINSQGAKALYYQGERASATNSWDDNEVVEIYYDGTSYYANNINGGSGSGVYDVSKEHPTSGPNGDGKFTLEYILNSSNVNELIPVNKREPGMTIQFVSTSDNKYVQYRLMTDSWSTDVADWQGVDMEPTAGSNNLVKSGGVQNELALGAVYDVSAKNPTAGPNNDGKWESLSALLLDSNLNTLIPTAVRKGGMSVKFVQSSDNKYVQYRLMNQVWSTNTTDWQGVDNVPTYGSPNLAGSNGVKKEIINLHSEVFESTDVYLFVNPIKGKRYRGNGWENYLETGCFKFEIHNKLSIPALSDGYQYILYRYVSDNEGVVVSSVYRDDAYTPTLDGVYVITFRKYVNGSTVKLTDADYESIKNIKCHILNDNSLDKTLNYRIDEVQRDMDDTQELLFDETETVNISIKATHRLGYYYPVTGGKHYLVNFVSSSNSALTDLGVYAWTDEASLGNITKINLGETKEVTVPALATRLYFYKNLYVESDTTLVVNITELADIPYRIGELETQVSAITDVVFPYSSDAVFCDNIESNVLTEMYFPNITSSWKIVNVTITNESVRFTLKDPNGDNIMKRYCLEDAVNPFYYGSDIIGYFILHKLDEDYIKASSPGFSVNVDTITNLDNSPIIKEYLSRKENIVLLGASLFGYKNDNVLLEYLTKKTDKFVINAGFPGSRGAYGVSTAGSSDWDKLSFVNVADCIVSGNYQSIENAIGNLGSSYSYFLDRLASLKTLDLTKPSTIFLGYGNNDITKGSPIGDLWAKEQSLATYDKTALLGALNYGMAKIMQAYPNVKVVVNTPIWRMIGGTVDPEGGTTGDPVAPYEYTNTLGLTFCQYLEAIETNCKRCGVRVFDTFRMGGRCVFNWDYYSVDNTHWNKAGFDLFSTALAEESKNI